MLRGFESHQGLHSNGSIAHVKWNFAMIATDGSISGAIYLFVLYRRERQTPSDVRRTSVHV